MLKFKCRSGSSEIIPLRFAHLFHTLVTAEMATSWLPIPRRPRDDEEEIRLVQIPEIVSLKSSIYSPSFVQDDQPVSERPANEHTVPTPIMLPKGRTMSLNPRKTWTEWTTILSDCLTVLLPLALMLFVVVVASTDNKQIDSRFDDLINALTVVCAQYVWVGHMTDDQSSWQPRSRFCSRSY